MKNMRKWLAKLVAVLLVMGLMPVAPGMTTARADTVITMNSNGVPGAESGAGWKYQDYSAPFIILYLNSGYAFTIINECKCEVSNSGTITDGTFNSVNGRFYNGNGGVINGGTFFGGECCE
jgi:hypothetical protein